MKTKNIAVNSPSVQNEAIVVVFRMLAPGESFWDAKKTFSEIIRDRRDIYMRREFHLFDHGGGISCIYELWSTYCNPDRDW